MISYYYSLFLVFSIICILMILDANVATYIFLLSKLVQVQYRKIKWIIQNDPRNPIVSWSIKRRSEKLAKELFDELNKPLDE